MLTVFGIPIFLYVDDAFWAALDCKLPDGSTQAAWIAKVFRVVATDLLGWELDPAKESVGPMLTLLGLDVGVSGAGSEWSVCSRKRTEWAQSIKHALAEDTLVPGMASKFCGRFAFFECTHL